MSSSGHDETRANKGYFSTRRRSIRRICRSNKFRFHDHEERVDPTFVYGPFSCEKHARPPSIGYLTQVRSFAYPVNSGLFPLLGEVIPMVVSAAKLEANRRNAQKSTGQKPAGQGSLEDECHHARLSRRDACAAGRGSASSMRDGRRGRPASGRVMSSSTTPSIRPSIIRGGKTGPGGPRPGAHARLEELADEEPAATADQEAVLELGADC